MLHSFAFFLISPTFFTQATSYLMVQEHVKLLLYYIFLFFPLPNVFSSFASLALLASDFIREIRYWSRERPRGSVRGQRASVDVCVCMQCMFGSVHPWKCHTSASKMYACSHTGPLPNIFYKSSFWARNVGDAHISSLVLARSKTTAVFCCFAPTLVDKTVCPFQFTHI